MSDQPATTTRSHGVPTPELVPGEAADQARPSPRPDRRSVLRAAGVLGAGAVGAGALAACGGGATTSGSGAASSTSATSSSGSSSSGDSSSSSGSSSVTGGSGSATSSAGGAAPSGTAVKTADVPVGGGVINRDELFVVTQPTAGTFKAFSATCTHQGCPVASVTGGTINCTCHGSKFDIASGSPTTGPAKKALPAKTATVSGDSVYVA